MISAFGVEHPEPIGKKLTPEELKRAKDRARKAGRRYPNAYDNMVSGGAKWRVHKAQKRNTAAGVAGVAGGTALATSAVRANKTMDVIRDRSNRFIDSEQARAKSKATPPGYKMARPASPSKENLNFARMSAKNDRITNVKLQRINTNANKARKAVKFATGMKGRGALISVGFLGAVPATWLGARELAKPKTVEKAYKKVDPNDVDAALGGGLAAAGGYQGGLYATKAYDRKIERKQRAAMESKPGVANKTKEILNNHRKTHGITPQTTKGDAKWLKFYRSYPKELQGYKFKRTMSYLHGGKSQVALTAGAGAIGAGVALAANRKFDPKPKRGYVTKGLPSALRGKLPGSFPVGDFRRYRIEASLRGQAGAKELASGTANPKKWKTHTIGPAKRARTKARDAVTGKLSHPITGLDAGIVRGQQRQSLNRTIERINYGKLKPSGAPYNAAHELRSHNLGQNILNSLQIRRMQELGVAEQARLAQRSQILKRATKGSAGFTPDERAQLDRRKRLGRNLSLGGGTLGLGALALRTPAGAKLALKGITRATKAGSNPGRITRGLTRISSKEAGATKLSNTTGILAIGSGAAGSFNYASQQRLERKRDANLAKSAMGNIPRYGKVARVGHARIADYRNGRFRIDYKGMDPNVQHWVPRKDITFYKPKKPKAPKVINPPKPKQAPGDTQETLF